MEPVEYVFRIDVFSPSTLPMRRLAEYLAALARMFGHTEHIHFAAVEEGSAKLRSKVDAVDAPKVADRLLSIRLGGAPKDAVAAKEELENLLANDNAVGELIEDATGQIVVPFVGRNRPKRIVLPPFREDIAIDGQLVNIGGKDTTAHATLQDGESFHTGISMSREMARELAPLLYGPVLRLHGNGRFERLATGEWKMTDFKTSRYEKLSSRSVVEVLSNLRDVKGSGLMDPDAARDLRDEGDAAA